MLLHDKWHSLSLDRKCVVALLGQNLLSRFLCVCVFGSALSFFLPSGIYVVELPPDPSFISLYYGLRRFGVGRGGSPPLSPLASTPIRFPSWPLSSFFPPFRTVLCPWKKSNKLSVFILFAQPKGKLLFGKGRLLPHTYYIHTQF